MFRNFLLTTYRSLYQNRITSIINVAGLALAVGCSIPCYHIIRYETSFDHFHTRADRIYRVILDWSGRNDSGHVHYPAADALQTDFPDFEMITRLRGPVSGKISFRKEDGGMVHFKEDNILYADEAFLKTFDFPSRTPISPTALRQAHEVLLTVSLAHEYFPNRDPLGEWIQVDNGAELKIVGLLEDPPPNTQVPFRLIVSYATFDRTNRRREEWLFAGDMTTYVTLRAGENFRSLNERLLSFTKKHVAFYKAGDYRYALQPLKEIHTSSGFDFEGNYYAPVELLLLPGFLGLVIMLIACINFINLSTGQLQTMSKEIMVRKVNGSSTRLLLVRVLLQQAVLVFIAISAGLALGAYLLTKVNELFHMINYSLTIDTGTVLFLALLSLFVSAISCLYPVFSRIGIIPVTSILKCSYPANTPHHSNLRKALIAFQLGSSMSLLAAAIVITTQINHWKSTDLRFRTKDIVTLQVPDGNPQQKQLLKNYLLLETEIQHLSYSRFLPLGGYFGAIHLSGDEKSLDIRINFTDEEFGEVYDLDPVAGTRGKYAVDSTVFINETLARMLGFSRVAEAVGNNVEITILPDISLPATIGVVFRDFVTGNPLEASTQPYLMIPGTENSRLANVALINPLSADLLNRIHTDFTKAFPDEIFTSEQLTTRMEASYEFEGLIQKTVQFIAEVSILISCIGIIGIIHFTAARRAKEFGVRRIVGANPRDILILFFREFATLVGIGCVAGGLVSFWLLQRWLENYPNHLSQRPESFMEAFVIVCLVTAFTIWLKVQKVANANPAASLKAE